MDSTHALLIAFLVAAGFGCESPRPTPSPMSPLAQEYLVEGQRALERQSLAEAVSFAEKARAIAPGSADVLFLTGRIRFEQGLMPAARAAYEEVERVDPAYPGLAHNLGNVAFRERRFRDALQWYRQAATTGGGPRSWHAAGGAYERLGIADSALWAYRRAADLAPDYAPAHSSLAEALAGEGSYAEALPHALAALKRDSLRFSYRYQYASLLVATGRPADALPLLVDLARERPYDYTSRTTLGRALQTLGRPGEARKMLTEADSIRARMVSVERKEQSARDLAISFENQVAYAEALREQGRLPEALSVYERARALRPSDLAVLNNLATLWQQTGDPETAREIYREIVERDSTVIEAWLNLALLNARLGQMDRARASWERARAIRPDHPLVRQLGEALPPN